ncbi:MAG: tetratricopeptide repeat protein [Betaproteobacteria bacterium]|nr:tetratricopeptide repeat protein [Betaproteobacteria bacterium]MDE2268062.1 tetratricopeptide repeat protein [Betaproteobacteria bacterium]
MADFYNPHDSRPCLLVQIRRSIQTFRTPMRAAVLVSALLFPALTAVPIAAYAQQSAVRASAQETARQVFAILAGEIAANTGHPGVAYTELLKAAKELDSEPLYRRAAEIALRAGAPDKALIAAQAWRKAMPGSREASAWVVQLLLLMGKTSEAGSAIAQDLANTPEPQRGQAIADLLPLAAQASDAAATLSMMRTALTGQRQFAQTDVVLGLLRARAGDQKGGFADALHALTLNPGLAPAAALLIQLYTVNPQAADGAMQKFSAAQPKDSGLRLAWAQAALAQQRDGIALNALDKLVVDAPDLAPAWLILGSLQTEFGQPARAVVSLQTYLRLARAQAEPPVLTPAYIALAEASRKLGDLDQANRWLDQIEPDASNHLAVLSNRAAILVQQGKVNDALKLAETLPDATEAQRKDRLLARAQVLREAGRFDASYKLLQSGLKQTPNDVDLLYEASMMADKSGHIKDMLQMLRKAIALDPESQPAYNALGYTLADRGEQLPEARKLVARALELSPGNPFVLDSMGWVEHKMGHNDQALDLLQQAYDARPDPEIGAHLGEVLWQLGQRDRARAIWHEAIERAPHDTMVQAVLRKYGVTF